MDPRLDFLYPRTEERRGARLLHEARDLLAAGLLDAPGEGAHPLAEDGELLGGDAVAPTVACLDVRFLEQLEEPLVLGQGLWDRLVQIRVQRVDPFAEQL